jgi:alkanesulfonate monooxygenase SsuD/methylene tetrahydromethanopterin reductase-like flavin-dependent oxidoreductase (luciferase family)
MAMARLGIVAANFSGLSFSELQDLAREAESAGIEAIFSPEFMNDALANCHIMAQATAKIKVGTWIANIYLRHPALCAQTAVAIDDTSKGRLILGLGVSHRPLVEGVYKEKMDKPREFLREYIVTVRDMVTGKGYPGAPTPPRAATHKVPIYVGALALGTIELSGELADGVMLYLCPKNRLPRVQAALEKGAAKAGRSASAVDITTGLPTCMSDDLNVAKDAARKNLAFYGGLPFYNKLFQSSGFVQEAAALAKGDAQGVSDRMAEELSLIGPPARCREQLAAFREAGIQLPIIVPVPVGNQTYTQAVRKAIETFA